MSDFPVTDGPTRVRACAREADAIRTAPGVRPPRSLADTPSAHWAVSKGDPAGLVHLSAAQPAGRGESRTAFELLRQVHTRLALDAEHARSPEERAHYLQLRQGVFEMMREQSRQAAPRVVFRDLGADRWLLGPQGLEREVLCSMLGLRAGHRALKGLLPHCSEFTPSDHACSLVSRAVRHSAAQWADRHGCRALAVALRGVHLSGGHLVYAPSSGAPFFVLD